jgi:hypothetical protein
VRARAVDSPGHRRTFIRRRSGEITMNLPNISIDSLPALETTVGLFGSITDTVANRMPSVFDVIIIFIMIVYD